MTNLGSGVSITVRDASGRLGCRTAAGGQAHSDRLAAEEHHVKIAPEGTGSRSSHLLYAELSSGSCPGSRCTDMRQLPLSNAGRWL